MGKRNLTYYEILGIAPNAKHNDVGLAFNRKMRAITRDDAPPDLQAETKLKEAFAVLSDLDQRAEYDAKLRADILKPKFGRNHGAFAALFVVAVGAGLFWHLWPRLAHGPLALEGDKPGKPYQEILSSAIPAVGRLQTVEMSGEALPAGIAFAVEEGVAVTSCRGLSPAAQLSVALAPRVVPARVTLSDDELGLCKLEVRGVGSWPLSVSQVPVRPGERVYAVTLGTKGEVSLLGAQVRSVRQQGKATVIDVSVPLVAQHAGSPLLDIHGRVVGVANVEPGGKGTYVAIPPGWGETVKLPDEPRPYQASDEPDADAPAEQLVDDLGVPLETRRKQEELARKIDPERRKRLEKAFRPPPSVPADL